MTTYFSKTVVGAVLALSMVGCSDGAESTDHEPASELAAQLAASRQIDIPVTVRGSGKATLRANVYANPKGTGTTTLLAVAGLAANASVYSNLTTQLFKDPAGDPVAQTITLDFPNHGGSTAPTGLPAGVRYGDLTIEDNADVLVQAIRALGAQNLAPVLVIGHGAGGLAIAAAQEALLSSGSSLSALGVSAALLYAPVPSRDRPWTQPTPNAQLSSWISTDPVLGGIYTLPTASWGRSGFTTTGGTVVAGAPTAEEVAAAGYAAVEPLATLNQLTATPVGGPAIPRPVVRAGAFATANGTRLIVVSYSENTQVPAADVADFYVHLTGDAAKTALAPIVAPDAVGNLHITNPAAVIESTRRFFVAP